MTKSVRGEALNEMVWNQVSLWYGFGRICSVSPAQMAVCYGGVITIFTPPDLLVVLFYYCSGVLMTRRGYTDFTAHYIVHPAWRPGREAVDLFLVTWFNSLG